MKVGLSFSVQGTVGIAPCYTYRGTIHGTIVCCIVSILNLAYSAAYTKFNHRKCDRLETFDA